MKSRSFIFSSILVIFLYVLSEILLRLGLLFFGYPFFRPGNYLYSHFYPYVKEVRSKEIQRGGEVKNVLILGGSVVSTAWTHMESRLDTILQKHYGNKGRFAFYNVAEASHTSRDNVLKYRLLEDKRFDLVLYYEAINENRANNVPANGFRQDYSHMHWYRDIYLLESHPEINITVIPYVLDKIMGSIKDRLEGRIYISRGEVDPRFAQYGSDIKTEESYRRNLEEIIAIARKRGDKLLLMSYASFFPENVVLTGKEDDMKHFAGCNRFVATPVVMWGKPENVKKGIGMHNQVLRELARKHNTLFLDMELRMPKDRELFCDVCHLSGLGAQRFAAEVSEFIVAQGLLE